LCLGGIMSEDKTQPSPSDSSSIAAHSQRGRDNNFNLIRVIAASLVLWTHAFGFTGNGQAELLKANFNISFGSWAVDIFFVLSGFLVAKSWDRQKSVRAFVWARALRIYPGLWACILMCVALLGPAFTSLSLTTYLTHVDTLKFLLANGTLLLKGVFPSLPGVFGGSPVNSPLWTLPYELRMYLVLLLLAWSGLLYRRAVLPVMVVLAFAIFSWAAIEGRHEDKLPEYCRFIFCFFSGAWLYVRRESVQLRPTTFFAVLMLLGLSLVMSSISWRLILLTAATPYLAIFLAFVPAGPVRAYNALGDYSYGVYIYGAPVQMSVLALAGGSMTPIANFAWSMCIALVLAVASWHLLESRALQMKSSGKAFSLLPRSLR